MERTNALGPMALAEGKPRHAETDPDQRNPRAAPRPLSSHVLHFLPSGRQDLHFPAWCHDCCVHRLNWIGHAPERMASGADPQLFGGFAALRSAWQGWRSACTGKDAAG